MYEYLDNVCCNNEIIDIEEPLLHYCDNDTPYINNMILSEDDIIIRNDKLYSGTNNMYNLLLSLHEKNKMGT